MMSQRTGLGGVEDLPELVGTDEDAAVFRDGEGDFADTDSAGALEDEVELFRAEVFVE